MIKKKGNDGRNRGLCFSFFPSPVRGVELDAGHRRSVPHQRLDQMPRRCVPKINLVFSCVVCGCGVWWKGRGGEGGEATDRALIHCAPWSSVAHMNQRLCSGSYSVAPPQVEVLPAIVPLGGPPGGIGATSNILSPDSLRGHDIMTKRPSNATP